MARVPRTRASADEKPTPSSRGFGAFVRRRPLLCALGLVALVLAATADERTFGLITDGQIMTRTAFSIASVGEIGIARGHLVSVTRPEGDAVTRYGMGQSLAQVPILLLAGPFEASFGPATSQTLFVLGQIFWIVLACAAAAGLAKTLGARDREAALAALATGLGSPLWAYASSDFSEPLQAALVAGAFALAGRTGATALSDRHKNLLAAAAGATAGFGLVTKSILIVLLPFVAAVVLVASAKPHRLRHLLFVVAGWLPFAGVWLAFEIVRFGSPFASYGGEKFSHSLPDGLWRLLVGPNKGLLLYFPLALLAFLGLRRLGGLARVQALVVSGFVLFTLVTTAEWWAWDGTAGWGPRLLVPTVPLLAALSAIGASAVPVAVFWILFGLGAALNSLGVLQPDAVTMWYYQELAGRPLSEAEASAYPAWALRKGADGRQLLNPHYFVHGIPAMSPISVSWHLLQARLFARDPLAACRIPPWPTDVPGQEIAVPLEQAVPDSALVFFRSRFRWPHLGMSLRRTADELDFATTYLDCVYDQALRAQDLRRGDRALRFGEQLYETIPGPQTAVAYCEGLRLAGRGEFLRGLAPTLPASHRTMAEFGMVLALLARDEGKPDKAERFLAKVIAADPNPAYRALAGKPPTTWPLTLREVLRGTAAGTPAPAP